MLQYGTPDWARPCLARLPLCGAFVLARLVLKRIGADHLQTLAQPQHAVLCLGARLGTAGCFPLSIWFCYPQKGARATKLNWGSVAHNDPLFDMLIRVFGGVNQCPK